MMITTRSRVRKAVMKSRSSERGESRSMDADCTSESPERGKSKSIGNIEDCHLPTASTGENTGWEPPYWRQHLDNIRMMRAGKSAPVDSMGAACCADPEAPPATQRYQILLALMLSSQTKDQVTFAAMSNLRRHGCTVEKILDTPEAKIAELIYPVGFYKRKAEYVRNATEILHRQYDDDLPDSVDDLCKLPGVGQKMAHLAMELAWRRPTGIGVDTHVHRISNRLGWCRTPTKTPVETRLTLQSWMPSTLWSEINLLLVGFGQQTCLPVKPLCNDCLNRGICPYARQHFSDD